MEEILKKIKERAGQVLGLDPATLTKDTLFSDLNMKSTHYTQITTYLEDEFDIEVPFLGFKRCKSFGEAAEYIFDLLDA